MRTNGSELSDVRWNRNALRYLVESMWGGILTLNCGVILEGECYVLGSMDLSG